MKNIFVATLSPLCLAMFAASAWADIEPFTLGGGETVSHDSNIGRSDDSRRMADWYSTTQLNGGVNQALGRDQLVGSAAVNYTDYRARQDHDLDSFGYQGALSLDWSTVGDLSGSLGADASRRRYLYGFEDVAGPEEGRNLETDSHAFAKLSLGGPSRWNIFAGFDANRRRFSSSTYSVEDQQQWSQNLGTTYSTSPDLSFGVTGSYVHGDYPNYGAPSDFDSKTISATTKYQASGNSSLNANLGYTSQNSDLQPTLRFISGGLHWNWTPPSRFTVNLGVTRSTDGGAAAATPNSLNDRSLNTAASLNLSYEATAKVSLVAGAQYMRRKYSNVKLPDILADGTIDPDNFTIVSGTSHTTHVSMGVHYIPTRTTDLSCSFAHEVRGSGSSQLVLIASNYIDNLAQCAASITFD